MIMETKNNETVLKTGAMKKRRVVMADGRRYLIYYTFENGSEPSALADGFSQQFYPPANADGSDIERNE